MTDAIRLTGIEKTFGAVVANRGADLQVAQGEIHALVGEIETLSITIEQLPELRRGELALNVGICR